ncbi:MAG: hypothetical protein JW910_10060, partial [Anaerolineae bacterium]|nr:hypothetical protein [Anaerolineae bacterium]
KEDHLFGLKENVIIGKLIPAGTGFHTYQDREHVGPDYDLAAQGAMDDSEDIDDDDDEIELDLELDADDMVDDDDGDDGDDGDGEIDEAEADLSDITA